MNANYEPHAFSRRSFLKGAGAVGAAGLLAACGSSSSTSGSTSGAASGSTATTGGLTEMYTYESNVREVESWNVLYSQSASDFNVLTNCVDGLLSADCYGKPVAAIAESWEHNEDASVWTFHLREDVDWCDVNGEVKGPHHFQGLPGGLRVGSEPVQELRFQHLHAPADHRRR